MTEDEIRKLVRAEIVDVLRILFYCARGNSDQNASARDFEHAAGIVETAALKPLQVTKATP